MSRKFLIAAALGVLASLPAPAAAYVSDERAQQAADRAVDWWRAQQFDDGAVANPWTLVALANAGVSAADLRRSPSSPSLQDYYADRWISRGVGSASTDVSRTLLVGFAGGIDGARLGPSQNIVARQLEFFDGKQLGEPGLINDDIFGVMALERNGVSDLLAPLARAIRAAKGDDGWSFESKPPSSPDVDMTGAAIAALCSADVDASDPDVADALSWLKTQQDATTGGFTSKWSGVNTNSTAWVVHGLRQCGIDPQSAAWTTASGKTPLDSILSMQQPDGSFQFKMGDAQSNALATPEAVTALVGNGFGAPPAARLAADDPTFRKAPPVTSGTVAPMALLIDHGPGAKAALRSCSIPAPVGGTVSDLLARAGQAVPASCAADVSVSDGRLISINGVAADPRNVWSASVDHEMPRATLDAPLRLGSVVRLRLVGESEATPNPTPGPDPGPGPTPNPGPYANPDPNPDPGSTPNSSSTPSPSESLTFAPEWGGDRPAGSDSGARGKLEIIDVKRRRLRSGTIRVAVRCPATLADASCTGLLNVSYRSRRGRRGAGSAKFSLRSGTRATISVPINSKVRSLARRSKAGLAIRLAAVTRNPATGSANLTRTRSRIVAPKATRNPV